ncbi:MAG: NAD(P)-dependent oxidoreductase [Dehalococcoidia bacterium]|nr:NAD(P)-dependent oxidoreductase [Dehalococcoidia bacterium]
MKVLVLAPFAEPVLDRLKQKLDVIYENWMDTKRLLSSAELVQRIQEQDIPLLVVEADFVQREVFEKASRLRFLGVCRADVVHVDVAAATEHGVVVVNTPGRNAVAVAELTLGLMLSLLRKIPAAHNMVSGGEWVDPTQAYFQMRGSELWRKTVGIVGFGAIGQQVAKRLLAFESAVFAYDPYVDSSKMKDLGVTGVELDELMSRSDVVTVHCTTTPETVGLISARRLSLMKPTAYFVNAASAYVVDEEALVRVLRERRIAGAAFDVYKNWPVKQNDPILKLDNVVLTPHIGGATDESVLRHSEMMADDIERFLKGERPKNMVNPQVWK